jgi:hypothetical protein
MSRSLKRSDFARSNVVVSMPVLLLCEDAGEPAAFAQ